MKVKTSELQGVALDWAVTKAMGEYKLTAVPNYSTDWAQGGPIVEREKIDVMWCGDRWCAYTMTPDKELQLQTEGPTPLIAAMRGYVASKMGDEIEVPDELLQGGVK